MKLWTGAGRRADTRAPVAIPDVPEVVAPTAGDLLGVLRCAARGCCEQSGIACAYTDRRDRACPTAWCPAHRVVVGDGVYCPAHAQVIGDTADPFGELERPDLDNPVPLLVAWAAHALEADVCALLHPLSDVYGQTFVADPLRVTLVGIDRVRTWERAWKMSSHLGNTLRIHVGVEEAHPDVVVARVNSNVVARMAPPPAHVRDLSEEPVVAELSQVERFRAALMTAIDHGVAAWKAGYHERPVAVPLSGAPQSIAAARAAGARQLRG